MKRFICLSVAVALLAACSSSSTANRVTTPMPLSGTWAVLTTNGPGDLQRDGRIVLSNNLVVLDLATATNSVTVIRRQLDPLTGAGSLFLADGCQLLLTPTKAVIDSGTGMQLIEALEISMIESDGAKQRMRLFREDDAALAMFVRHEHKPVVAQQAAPAPKSVPQVSAADQQFRAIIAAAARDFQADAEALISAAATNSVDDLARRQQMITDAYRRSVLQDLKLARMTTVVQQRVELLAQVDQRRRQLAAFENGFATWSAY